MPRKEARHNLFHTQETIFQNSTTLKKHVKQKGLREWKSIPHIFKEILKALGRFKKSFPRT